MDHTGLPPIRLSWAADQRRMRAEGIVYYLERWENAVKIGCTRNYPSRRGHLLRQNWPLNLVAWEFGYFDLESQRHEQFAHLRLGRAEWFAIDEGLMDHILMLRALL